MVWSIVIVLGMIALLNFATDLLKEKARLSVELAIKEAAYNRETQVKIATRKYGEPRRQDQLEKRLEELEKTLRNLSPEKLDALRNDVNDLKLKVGFR